VVCAKARVAAEEKASEAATNSRRFIMLARIDRLGRGCRWLGEG
jgi:hypothetical protein